MDSLIRSTGFTGDFAAFTNMLRTDPKFFYTDSASLVRAYRDITKRIDPELPKLFGRLPRLTYGVSTIPSYAAPSQTTAYYQGGSPEAHRAGQFFVNTYKLDTRPTWEMEVLTAHEAVPGHHLQIAISQELEGIPEFRRYGGYTAFVEGWALYSESLGPELGLEKDPYSKFGQLTYEMWRAIRLVIDTGIHSLGWSRQQAIDYFKANSAKTENDITVEVDRYIVWPGQALAYKSGELEIKALRKYAEQELGPKFDIRAFHDQILSQGRFRSTCSTPESGRGSPLRRNRTEDYLLGSSVAGLLPHSLQRKAPTGTPLLSLHKFRNCTSREARRPAETQRQHPVSPSSERVGWFLARGSVTEKEFRLCRHAYDPQLWIS